MGHTLGQWDDRIRARLGDAGVIQHVEPTEILSGLEAALHQFGTDLPRQITETFAGDGTTFDFTLTSWEDRLSRIVHVEYPAGEREPQILDPARYLVLPGTSTLRLLDDTPATGETVNVIYHTPVYPFPDDTPATDLVPDVWISGLTALAASLATTAAAVRAGRQQSNSVAGNLFQTDSEALRAAARDLRQIYDSQVLGIQPAGDDGERPNPVGYGVRTIETFPNTIFERHH